MRKGFMAKVAVATTLPLAAGGIAYAAGTLHEVKPHSYDPAHTFLVSSGWINALGCVNDAGTTSDGVHLDGTYSDGACPTGDKNDPHHQGLVLNKQGPTGNYAIARAELKDVAGINLNELGYDLRKPGGDRNDPRGSHCGGGAPRFNITWSDGTSDITTACNSTNAATVTDVGQGWMRIRFTPPAAPSGATVKSISLVYDEGTDAGSDNFGMAVLDNIDVNGVLVGHGDNGDAA